MEFLNQVLKYVRSLPEEEVSGRRDIEVSSDVKEYLFELGVTQNRALTPAGRVLKSLRTIEARRWLLHLEVAQSLGVEDNWRVHLSVLRELLKSDIEIDKYDPTDKEEEYSARSLDRLSKMGIVFRNYASGVLTYTLRAEARPLVEELLSDPPTPLGILARSLTSDISDQSFSRWTPAPSSSSAVTNLLAARMVAHEIRNSVVPIQTNVDKLIRDCCSLDKSEKLERYQQRIRSGLQRVLNFADEQLRVAEMGLPPHGLFMISDAIEAAISETEGERNGRVSIRSESDIPDVRLSGDRGLFIRVMVNLFRNAAQANPERSLSLQIQVRLEERYVVVTVDDDGEGVPEEDRENIFTSGFSRGEGSGQGLALAKTVIEEMRGHIFCETSPTGGARFVLKIPAPERTP